jgi:parallel beta-helix repeat protein
MRPAALIRLPLREDARRHALTTACAFVLLALVVAQLVITPRTRSATTHTLLAKADSVVDGAHPDANFGRTNRLLTDRLPFGRRSYVRFDLPTLDLREVKRARLHLFSRRANPLGAAVYASGDAWSETGITLDGSPRPGALLGHSGPLARDQWVSIDLTDAVRSGAAGTDARLSVVIKRSPFSNRVVPGLEDQESETAFASREAGATPPQLVLTMSASTSSTSVPTTSVAPSTTLAPPTTVAPQPPPPATTALPTTAPPAPAAPACVAVRGSVQAAVDASPSGTRFCVSGTITERITPRSGQTFVGPAVFDGAGRLDRAFGGAAADVTLERLEVRNYNPGRQNGAIEPEGDGWTLRNVDVNHNGWGGIYIHGNRTRILGGRVSDHAGLGIGDDKVTGTVIDGTEIARNGFGESCGFEAGGVKFVGTHTTVRGTFTHHNQCKGLWWDINAAGTLVEGNLIEDNWDEGVFYEISQDAVIRNNTIRRNGLHNYNAPGRNGCPWLFGGGITVASSFNVEIYGNRLDGNCNGIAGTQQDRTDSTPPAHLLQSLYVHDNVVNGSGSSGVAEDNGADLASRAIVFVRNAFGAGHDVCGFSC